MLTRPALDVVGEPCQLHPNFLQFGAVLAGGLSLHLVGGLSEQPRDLVGASLLLCDSGREHDEQSALCGLLRNCPQDEAMQPAPFTFDTGKRLDRCDVSIHVFRSSSVCGNTTIAEAGDARSVPGGGQFA